MVKFAGVAATAALLLASQAALASAVRVHVYKRAGTSASSSSHHVTTTTTTTTTTTAAATTTTTKAATTTTTAATTTTTTTTTKAATTTTTAAATKASATPAAASSAAPVATSTATPDFPTYTGARESNDGTHFVADFNVAIQVLSAVGASDSLDLKAGVNCAKVFENPSTAQLWVAGKESGCKFMQVDSEYRVFPEVGLTTPVALGKNLTLLTGIVGKAGVTKPTCIDGKNGPLTHEVKAATAPVTPDISKVRGSGINLASDASFTIFLSLAKNNGGRWLYVNVSCTAASNDRMAAVNAILGAQAAKSKIMTTDLDATAATEAVGNYTFLITFTNRFNKTATKTIQARRYAKGEVVPADPKIFSDAPVIEGVYFGDDFSGFYVVFEDDIELFDYSKVQADLGVPQLDSEAGVACSKVFQNAADGAKGRLYNTDADCIVVTQQNILLVAYDPDYFADITNKAAVPGDEIKFLANVIGTGGPDDVEYTLLMGATTKTISNPINPPMPNVQLVGSTLIASCAIFKMDLTASTGAAGRAWALETLEYTTKAAAADGTALAAALTEGKTSNLNGEGDIRLDNTVMPVGNYEFKATLKNFLGYTDVDTLAVTRSTDANIPEVLFLVSFDESPAIESYIDLAVAVDAAEGCDGGLDDFAFAWSQVAGDAHMVPVDALGDTTLPYLSLEPMTLKPGKTYNFKVALKSETKGAEAPTYEWTLTFTSALNMITADVSSGEYGTESDIVLSADVHDSAVEEPEASDYTCEWKCFDLNVQACVNADGVQLSFSDTSSCSTLDLTGKLASGLYLFGAVVTSKDTGAKGVSDIGVVSVVPGKPLLVDISNNALAGKPSPDMEGFALTAAVSSLPSNLDASELTYKWESLASCAGKAYSTVNLASPTDLASEASEGVGISTLGLNAAALDPGSSYCIKVSVMSGDNSVLPGVGTQIFKVRKAPADGSCKLIFANPTPLDKKLKVQCNNWKTDPSSGSVWFKMDINNDPTDESGWVTSAISKDAVTELTIPDAGNNWQLRITVFDEALSFAKKPLTFDFKCLAARHKRQDTAAANAKAFTFLDTCSKTFDKSGDLKALSTCLSTISASDNYLKNYTIASKALDLLTKLTNLTMTRANSNSFTSIANRVATLPAAAALDANYKNTLVASLYTVVNKTLTVGRRAGTCADDATLNTWYSILKVAYSTDLSSTFAKMAFQLDELLARCVAVSLSCGSKAKTFTVDNNFKQQMGAAQATRGAKFGEFTLSPKARTPVCMRYSSLVASAPGSLAGTIGQVKSLTLINITTNQALAKAPDGTYTVTFDLTGDVKAQVDAKKQSPQCVYLKYTNPADASTAQLASDGVTTSYSNGKVTCESIHLTAFTVRIVSGNDPTDTPKAAVPAASFGGFAAAFVTLLSMLAAGVFMM